MAQLVEQQAVLREVAGLNPTQINTKDLKSAAFVISSAYGYTLGPISQISSDIHVNSLRYAEEPIHYLRRVGLGWNRLCCDCPVLPSRSGGLGVMSLKKAYVV